MANNEALVNEAAEGKLYELLMTVGDIAGNMSLLMTVGMVAGFITATSQTSIEVVTYYHNGVLLTSRNRFPS